MRLDFWFGLVEAIDLRNLRLARFRRCKPAEVRLRDPMLVLGRLSVFGVIDRFSVFLPSLS